MMEWLRPSLRLLQPYETNEPFWRIKLDANENAFGLPAAVAEKVAEAISRVSLNRYPEIAASKLRQAIAEFWGLAKEDILVGNGSSELIAAACLAFGGTGRSIVFPEPSFSMYPIYARLADSLPVPVLLGPDFTLSPAGFIAAAKKSNAGLVILCNPNNPTGTVYSLEAIRTVAGGVSCPVLVDEAYMEFAGEFAGGAISQLLKETPNLMVARTFSKAYGLAAARVGYLAARRETAEAVAKVLLPYHVNAFSLAAAEAVFAARSCIRPVVSAIVEERERLAGSLANISGVRVFPSGTNFLLCRVPDADVLIQGLAEAGIGVRRPGNSPALSGCVRVTVGTPAENDAFLTAVRYIITGKTGG